jgi:hypothetical protein
MEFPRDSQSLVAIERLIRRMAKRLKQYKILANEAEADLFQDLYVCVLNSWHNYDPKKGAIEPFVWQVLQNSALNILRDRYKKKAIPSYFQTPLDEDVLEDDEYPKAFDDVLLAIDVQKKLSLMPAQTRQFVEKLNDSAAYKVAREMGLSRKKLKQHLACSRDFFSEINNFFSTEEVFMNIPLNFLDDASAREVSNLSIRDLQTLAARLKEAIETQDRCRKVLNEAMRLRFEDTARAKLNQEGKDTGTVRFQEGNTTVIANFRKRVDWEQEELARILAEHPEYKTDVKCVLSLEERKYNNWPISIQKIFEPARSVKIGGYEFSFNNLEEI